MTPCILARSETDSLLAASVYETVGCPSVRPSVRLSRRFIAAATCSGFAAARAPTADIGRYVSSAQLRIDADLSATDSSRKLKETSQS